MIDPDNVLLRCPNGHELQAARGDLHQELSCPVCNVTFKPHVETPPPTLAYGAAGDFAGNAGVGPFMTSRPEQPAFTTWMLGCWLLVLLWLTASSIYDILGPSAAEKAATPSNASMPFMMLLGSVFCVTALALVAAMILQLMWNYRVHSDAQKFGGYFSISPGLALGLTFLPVFNVVWTAFLLMKLAAFAAMGEREKNPGAQAAVHTAKVCFITGILGACTFCSLFGLTMTSAWPVYQEMIQQGVTQRTPEFNQKIQEAAQLSPVLAAASMLIYLAACIAYVVAVRRVEKSLYERLGATPR